MTLQSWLAAYWQPLLIGVLLGLILGWLIFGLRSRSRQRQLEAGLQSAQTKLAHSEKALDDARQQFQTAQANFGDADASLNQARSRLLAWQTSYRSLEEELTAAQTELAGLKDEAAASTPAGGDQVGDLQQQVADLQTQVADMQTLLSGSQAARAAMDEELAAAQSMLTQGMSAHPADLHAPSAAAPAVAVAGETGLLAAQTVTEAVAPAQTQLAAAPTSSHRLQALTLVKGIGSVFQQRLYQGGVGTFWQVANLPDQALSSLLRLGGLQARRFDFDATRADAHRLAQESGTVGLTWQGTRVDDFEPLPGLGQIFEQRLYEAGICTFEDLIDAGPEKLAAIVQAPAMNTPDFEGWIDIARKTLAEQGTEPADPPA